ncbi:MAG: RloB domain-containing protein [Paludibacteraceae bacterium]|nr:RloB domain-containing protein [Paludibacteraceae bacterium]
MARQSQNKSLNSSIIIVCEGTETENEYLKVFADESVIECRVVPQPEEIVDKAAKKNREKKIERQLKEGDDDSFTGPEYYVGLPEIDQKTYDEYRCEPRRWVRATQLFMERKGFSEGWAVYDLDNKSGRTEDQHRIAREDASKVENLFIAFSSYCIEEWFLLHFERNTKAFDCSECKYKKDGHHKENIGCGDASCICPEDNCHGEKCLSGYLREKGYIKEYSKNKGADYVDITRDKLHKACVNAVWSRSLKQDAQPFECNPYTDIDKLILRLLGKENNMDIRWVTVDKEFKVGSSTMIIRKVDLKIRLECLSKTGFLVDPNSIFWCNDDDYQTSIQNATNLSKKTVCDQNNPIEIVNKPHSNAILCLKNGNQEFYFEL